MKKIFFTAVMFLPVLVFADPISIHEYYQKAEQAIKTSNLQDALSTLSTAVTIYPNEAKAWYNMGVVYKDMNHADPAGDCFSKAIELEPKMKNARFNMAKVRTLRSSKYFDLAKAIDDFDALFKDDPTDYRILIELADIHYRQKSMTKLKETAELMEKLSPERPETYYYAGMVDEYSGHIEKALSTYSNGYIINPKSDLLKDKVWENTIRMGHLSYQKGNLKEAYPWYKKAFEFDSDRPETYLVLGQTAILAGDEQTALLAYSRFTGFRPDSWLGYANIADIISKDKNQRDKALHLAMGTISLSGDRWEPRDTLGWIYLCRGDIPEAKKQFQWIANAHKANWTILTKGNYLKALKELKKMPPASYPHLLALIKKGNAPRAQWLAQRVKTKIPVPR